MCAFKCSCVMQGELVEEDEEDGKKKNTLIHIHEVTHG